MNTLLRPLLAALLLMGGVAATVAQPAVAPADLPPPLRAKVDAAVKRFVGAPTKADRSANDLGWDCQAAALLAERGVEGAKPRLTAIADELLRDVVRQGGSDGKALGWVAAAKEEGASSCQRSTSASANLRTDCASGPATLYAFQSGLGAACLAKAGRLLERKDYVGAATEVVAYWDTLTLRKAPCAGCVYFATSNSATEDTRYVRNMNLFMALGASELPGAGRPAALARQAVQSDIWERGQGNRGYLGRLDPLWSSRAGEAERIENHAASMALLLNTMGATLNDAAISRHALTVWKDWASCDNKRCQTAGCKYWAGNANTCQATATAAHCAFRLQEDQARRQCETYLDQADGLGGYALWSVMQARPR